jgi:hypothetical protein
MMSIGAPQCRQTNVGRITMCESGLLQSGKVVSRAVGLDDITGVLHSTAYYNTTGTPDAPIMEHRMSEKLPIRPGRRFGR